VSTTTAAAHALGVTTGRRELAERIVGELRRRAARWRGADASPRGLLGSLQAAFVWSVTERWCARLEELAAGIETELAQLRTDELAKRAAYEQALASTEAP